MAKPGWMGSTGIVDAGDPPEAAAERCECEGFDSAVNDEVIYLDPASEDESARWKIASNSPDLVLDMPINFCPFCGLLVPVTARSGGEKP